MIRVLIVDDDEDLLFFLSRNLEEEGFETISANSGSEAVSQVKTDQPDVILLDLKLPDMTGFDVMKKVQEINNEIVNIIITGEGGISEALKAIKLGAKDYVVKPFQTEEIIFSINRALENQKLSKENRELKQAMIDKDIIKELMGESLEIDRVLRQVDVVAPTDMTVVVQGESGTGKEVIANMIHQKSNRKGFPIIALNCGAIPDTLVESELFGYEKGAFTGATSRKEGVFEQAKGGTLFLDEITNLPEAAQAKLLRVLQEKKVRHLGGKKDIQIDTRIITASNVFLTDAIKEGILREDLFYRLNEFSIVLPPLRERNEDIPILANYFLSKSKINLGKDIDGFTPETMEILMEYSWPGNVRELQNVVKKAALLAKSDHITPDELPSELTGKTTDLDDNLKEMDLNRLLKKGYSLHEITQHVVASIEKEVIENVLIKTKYNKSETAKILQIDRKTLYSKLETLNIK
ncbi:sigma-54-dependent Fis family transcriptional regulator [bacterium]|nr:sigma-54-dependent Fis family transcriptional regulator [bacterium]